MFDAFFSLPSPLAKQGRWTHMQNNILWVTKPHLGVTVLELCQSREEVMVAWLQSHHTCLIQEICYAQTLSQFMPLGNYFTFLSSVHFVPRNVMTSIFMAYFFLTSFLYWRIFWQVYKRNLTCMHACVCMCSWMHTHISRFISEDRLPSLIGQMACVLHSQYGHGYEEEKARHF